MTPDIHTKTYAERQSLASTQANVLNTQPTAHKNIGQSAKVSKQSNMMGMTLGA
jgi:hypothetical protein